MGPRPNPGGGSAQFTPSTSQANSAEASSGILPFADVSVCANATAQAARTATPALRAAVIFLVVGKPSRNYLTTSQKSPATETKPNVKTSVRM